MERLVSTFVSRLCFDDIQLLACSPELGVEFWEFDEYWDYDEPNSPPPVIPFDSVICQLSRGIIHTTEPHIWITISMEKVSNKLDCTF